MEMFSLLQILSLGICGVVGALVLGGEKPCPDFNCTQGGHTFCFHIPCPLQPCKDAVTTPGECCPHCPNKLDNHHSVLEKDLQRNCTPPLPCPPPPCQDSFIPADQCCPVCPNDCPHICKINGQKFCGQPPCPPPVPGCKNVLTPGDCCTHCEI